uniref:DUF7798 domain-containing protein n=2 Tax=Chenopodium quinoa TaxID=63459 RepID=A0A803LE07_CHEQI
SPLSYLSDLQKAAALAAEEIRTAAESFGNIEDVAEEEPLNTEDDTIDSVTEGEDGKEKEKLMSALDKLEKASEDTFFSQGLKVIDGSVENFASGAWKALGSAFQGGSNLIQKLEHSAVSIADSVQHDASLIAPSFLETGKAITFKGMQVLENVGKETMDLLISETGIEVDKKFDGDDHQSHDNLLYEEMTFDRCFYIYGGPEQLEELEALSSHYSLIFNRRKAKLSSEEKSLYEGKVKQVEEILNLNTETERTTLQSDKGKNIKIEAEDTELKSLHDSSLSKAADLAAGFTSALAGVSANDIIQRTTGRLETLHSEGVHRLSEICCFAMSQLLMLGKSMISSANKNQEINADEDRIKIQWPEDSLEKAKIIRSKAQSMIESMEAVSKSFITGISDVTEAYLAAVKVVSTTDSHETPPEKSIQDRANAFSELLRADQTIAVDKIQDGLQYLCFVAVSTSMPPAP